MTVSSLKKFKVQIKHISPAIVKLQRSSKQDKVSVSSNLDKNDHWSVSSNEIADPFFATKCRGSQRISSEISANPCIFSLFSRVRALASQENRHQPTCIPRKLSKAFCDWNKFSSILVRRILATRECHTLYIFMLNIISLH